MGLLKPLLMLSLLALSQSSCTQQEIDSFCLLYNKVIVEKGDSKIIATIGVKKRLLENEKFYVENCPQPVNP
jgi:hypothetical protein